MATTASSAGSNRGVVAELTLAKSGQSTPLTAISLSNDQRLAVVGGHGIMKAIRLAPEGLSEVATLTTTGRRKITGSAGSKLSMYDVAFRPSGGHVAASLSNGGVAVWDLQHLSSASSWAGQGQGQHGQPKEETGSIIGTHDRSVNRLCWNPFDDHMVLSGSQDGYMKIWDLRCTKAIATFNSYGAVRDVQFSPLQEFHFAAVFDDGKLQIWDYKFPHQPKMRIASHTKSAFSVEWHPAIPWRLATTSGKVVEIWDVEPHVVDWYQQQQQQAQQLQAPVMEQTLQSTSTVRLAGMVSRTKWRPGHDNQLATAQVPSRLGDTDFAIVVHDVTDTAIPHFALYGGDDKKNGFCWLDTPLSFENNPGALPSSPGGGGGTGAPTSSRARRVGAGVGNEDAGAEWCGMGVWQHLLSCSDHGKVRVHSLAHSTLPRRNLEMFGTRGFIPSSRGEMCSWLHRRNNDPSTWHLYQAQDAPGMFREDLGDEGEASDGRLTPPSVYQPQWVRRSLSAGDQTGISTMTGRRLGGAMSTSSPVGQAPWGQRTARPTLTLPFPRSSTLPRGGGGGIGGGGGAGHQSSRLTVYPVPDKPVALDVVHWRRIRRKETRCFQGTPQPRTDVQRCYGPELTEQLTRSYVLRGYHLRVLAAHNAEVCIGVGLESMAHTWRLIGILLCGVPGRLLLPLGATVPDIDVAGIDEGMAAAVAAAAASAGVGNGANGAGGARNLDSTAGRERDFSVPEVLDLIDKHEKEKKEEDDEEDDEDFLERQLTPEQRQQQLSRVPAPRQPSRATKASRGGAAGVGSGDLKLPPRRPGSASPPFSTAALGAAVAVTATSSESVSSSSRHGMSYSSMTFSGGGGGGGGASMWQPLPSGGRSRTYTATTVDGDDEDGRDDSDVETTVTTTFAATESAWWENDDRTNRGGGLNSARAASRAGKAMATVNGESATGGRGKGAARGRRHERRERLHDEVTLDWLWKSQVRDWLTTMSEAGFAYDTLAVLEVVRSWYYDTGPGRGQEEEDDEADLEEMRDINDAPGFWLGTDIPNIQVRMWYLQGLETMWQLQLHSAATDIIKHSGDPYVAQLHMQNTTLYPFCTGCGSSRPSGTSTWCNKCVRPASACPLCDLPVVGQYVECPGCHHGGHVEHMMNWFLISSECPVETCSHVCRPFMPGAFKPAAAVGTAAELRQWQEFHSLRLRDQ